MNSNNFTTAHHRIVRIKNDYFFDELLNRAILHNVPLQIIVNVVLDCLVMGYVYDTELFWQEVDSQAQQQKR